MYLFFSVIPATIWVVLGYFVLFTSTKAQGAMQTFGQVLAIFIFVIAALFPLIGAYATFTGLGSVSAMMQSMHSGGSP